MKQLLKNKLGIAGSYVIKKHCSLTGKLLWQSDPIENLVVSSSGYGRNLLVRQMSGDTTYPIVINSCKIGTGTNTPADSDTDLQTSVLSVSSPITYEVNNNQLILTFFIPTANLADGTYREFGLFMTSRLFARSLISPVR